jgi:hypothetical protein
VIPIKINMQLEHLTFLAPMECLSSCLVTYMKSTGLNFNYFLMDYWSLQYQSGVLLSSRNPAQFNLNHIYGMESSLNRQGDKQQLIQRLDTDGVAFISCMASGFSFFPKNMLDYESSGFLHCVLVYDYQTEEDLFLLADPVVGFIGKVTYDELLAASVIKNEIEYYTLTLPKGFQSLNPEEIFRISTNRNLSFYTNGADNEGVIAIDRYMEDIRALPSWTDHDRDSWIGQNNITLTAIMKMRSTIWTSYCTTRIMTDDQTKHGSKLIDIITRAWATLNFLTMKYKRNPTQSNLINSIEDKLNEIKVAELQFLEYMVQVARELP